jgi:hypothetical protein
MMPITYLDWMRRKEIDHVRSSASRDLGHVSPNLGYDLPLKRASEHQFSPTSNCTEAVFAEIVYKSGKGFKVPTLVATSGDGACGWEYIEGDAMAGKMSTNVLEVVVAVTLAKVFQGKPDLLDNLIKRCHSNY